MANLRTAMDAAFWDLNVSSPQQLLFGSAKWVPGGPFPADGARAGQLPRFIQLSLLEDGFPKRLIPNYYVPASRKDLEPLALQCLYLQGRPSRKWWVGLVTQVRPQKLISDLISEVSALCNNVVALDMHKLKDDIINLAKVIAKDVREKSFYSLGVCSEMRVTPSTTLLLSTEAHGERKGRRTRAMLHQKLPLHDITIEGGWPELYRDHNGKYWEVPESISLDCSSLITESGFRYRFGLHKNAGCPQAVDSSNGEVPLALMPGVCAKAAFSFEKSKDLWRRRVKEEEYVVERDGQKFWRPAFDILLKEPHVAISGIIGVTYEAWFGGKATGEMTENGGIISVRAKRRGNMFGSIGCTLQLGTFRKLFVDLTRLDAHLDICSASAFAKRAISKSSSPSTAENPSSYPSLNLTFQQQVLGPFLFRVSSKYLLHASSGKLVTQMEDLIYSLNYCSRTLRSAKVVAWYSPKRKEGMVEFRMFEF